MEDKQKCEDFVPVDKNSGEPQVGTKAYSYRYCNSLYYEPFSDETNTERVRCCFIDVKDKNKDNTHYRGCLPVKARELDNIDDFINAIETGENQGEMKINIEFYTKSSIKSLEGTEVKVLDCSSSYIYPFLLISLLLLF